MEGMVLMSFFMGCFGFAFGVDAKLRLAKIEKELERRSNGVANNEFQRDNAKRCG